MKNKIRLDTRSDVDKFVEIAQKSNFPVRISDGTGLCVNGKSLIGVLYTLEFHGLWVECDSDIYESIKDFVI